jgi:hypothetical protein
MKNKRLGYHRYQLKAPSGKDTTWPNVRENIGTQKHLAEMELEDYHCDWRLSDSAIEFIVEALPKGSNILEFGGGLGTLMLYSRGFELLTVEEDIIFVNYCHTNYCFAPIKDGWYDKSAVKRHVEGVVFDAIIIDGPAQGERDKILDCNFIDFDTPKFILIDDPHRSKDSTLLDALKQNKRHQLFDTYGVIFND